MIGSTVEPVRATLTLVLQETSHPCLCACADFHPSPPTLSVHLHLWCFGPESRPLVCALPAVAFPDGWQREGRKQNSGVGASRPRSDARITNTFDVWVRFQKW